MSTHNVYYYEEITKKNIYIYRIPLLSIAMGASNEYQGCWISWRKKENYQFIYWLKYGKGLLRTMNIFK